MKTRPRISRQDRIRTILRDLQTLPGVGPSIARDLYQLGFRSAASLATADPERMYDRLCRRNYTVVDRCVLYVFRCAVYASRTARPSSGLLLWWNWKDRPLKPRIRG